MARSARYARVLESAKYYPALKNYLAYMQDADRRGENVGKGTPRAKSQVLYIDPFGIALAATQVVRQTAAQPSWTTYKADFAGRTSDAAPADLGLVIPVRGYKAARVNITTGRATKGTPKRSKVTKMPYLDYGGKSTSIPFGRTSPADTETAAFAAIRAKIVDRTSGAAVSLIPEKYGV